MLILTFIYVNYFKIVALISVWNYHKVKQFLLAQVLTSMEQVEVGFYLDLYELDE